MLKNLKEAVTEKCYNDILLLIEGLFIDDGRDDLLDKIARATSGRTLKQRMGLEGRAKQKTAQMSIMQTKGSKSPFKSVRKDSYVPRNKSRSIGQPYI